MADAGWYDDGSGRQRWWDGQDWTERYRDVEENAGPVVAPESTAPEPLRVFKGNGNAGSQALTVYPNLIEFEHLNYFAAIPLSQLGPIGYSKKQKSPYDGVNITPSIDFHCDNPREVYEYLRGLITGS